MCNHPNEGHSLVAEQIDRAPIIVSTNNQSDATASIKGKDICKSSRSVIVRAGTVTVSDIVIIFCLYISNISTHLCMCIYRVF